MGGQGGGEITALTRRASRKGRFGDASARDDRARTRSQRQTFLDDACVTISAIGAQYNTLEET